MFCPKCGKENPDGARFCAGCGKAFEDVAPAAPVQETVVTEAPVTPAQTTPSTSAPTTPSSTESFMDKVKTLWVKKEVKVGVAIAAVAIIAIILLCGGGGGASSPEGAVENFMGAMIDCDVDGMIDMIPPCVIEDIEDSKYFEERKALWKSNLEEKFSGANCKCEVFEKERLSTGRRADFEDEYDTEIEEAYEVKFEWSYDSDSGWSSLSVGKIGGRWYVLTSDLLWHSQGYILR